MNVDINDVFFTVVSHVVPVEGFQVCPISGDVHEGEDDVCAKVRVDVFRQKLPFARPSLSKTAEVTEDLFAIG